MSFKMPTIPRPKIVDKWMGTGDVSPKPMKHVKGIDALDAKHKDRLDAAKIWHNKHGWLMNTCDAMLSQGKYAAATGRGDLSAAAHWPDQPGRYGRRSAGTCWEDGKDLGSKTTWSRDMGMGLLWWTWRTKDKKAIGDHINYGLAHTWKMGEPFADGRVMYTPNMIALCYRVHGKLVGHSYVEEGIGDIYSMGLTDYEAHLTVLGILLRGEIVGSIWQRHLKIIEEQAKRQPRAPLYAAAKAIYTGSYQQAVDALLEPVFPDYISNNERAAGELADAIFAGDLILRRHG